LEKYVAEYYDARVPTGFKFNDYLLGSWVSHQRKEKNKLSPKKILLLEALPQWSWNPLENHGM